LRISAGIVLDTTVQLADQGQERTLGLPKCCHPEQNGLVQLFSRLNYDAFSHVYVIMLQQILVTKATAFVNATFRHVAYVKAEAWRKLSPGVCALHSVFKGFIFRLSQTNILFNLHTLLDEMLLQQVYNRGPASKEFHPLFKTQHCT
jgi:hypothetical protein